MGEALSDSRIDLSGVWLIRPDPDNVGEQERWWERAPDVPSQKIVVPCAWQDVLGHEFHGVAWYRRLVSVPDAWLKGGSRFWLRFESAATDCRAWVNGREVGRHVGDYLPFQFEVTSAAQATPGRKGEGYALDILIRVDEMHAPRPAPGILTENGHITKGFHDVLSLHHGGMWGGVSLRRTGPLVLRTNGVRITPRIREGRTRVQLELFPGHPGGLASVKFKGGVLREGGDAVVLDGGVESVHCDVKPREELVEVELTHRRWDLRPWSHEAPERMQLEVSLREPNANSAIAGRVSDSAEVSFGYRTVATGGPSNSQILLNNKPILLRGVLHWGHEPSHGSPAPTPEEVREEFARLKALGFNLVCLCMVYMPEYFYDIADEMGMLIWQEHPVWKSPMEDELIPEYQRLFRGFFRRDRSHPSVILVSGACEHERFNPALARWWWDTSRRELPGTLIQVQTAFLAWTNPAQTDLHDEHTYENSGRFAAYMDDVHDEIERIGHKPFIMGETIIGTSWLDTGGRVSNPPQPDLERAGSPPPPKALWWAPKGFAECQRFEAALVKRHGHDVLARFKRQADEFNLAIRRFQSELFRSVEGNAGWVMNHIRDVPQCRCGFKDDGERWRFTPEQTRPWLGDAAVLLRTPDHRRGFTGGRLLAGGIGLSNFSGETFDGVLEATVVRAGKPERLDIAHLRAGPGEVRFGAFELNLPRVDRPTKMPVAAAAGSLASNAWNLWVFPSVLDAPADVVRLDGLPFSEADMRMDWEERAYSSGWGLKVQSWRPVLPDLSQLLFKCPLWRFDAPMPLGTRVVVTHKLTERLIGFMEAGGRVVLLASKTVGGMDARTVMLWGQCPLVIEDGPLEPGESEWVLDLLHHDLTRRHPRAVPVEDMGIADQVDPVVRLVFTHDAGAPKLFDAVFKTRVGKGMLIASSLDHSEDTGRYLLHRLIRYSLESAAARSQIDSIQLRRWTVEAAVL